MAQVVGEMQLEQTSLPASDPVTMLNLRLVSAILGWNKASECNLRLEQKPPNVFVDVEARNKKGKGEPTNKQNRDAD